MKKLLPILLILCTLGLFTKAASASGDLYSIEVKTLGMDAAKKPSNLNEYRGKVLLIANTASGCGFTPQYEGLESISRQYRDRGLVVFGFPSNDFGGQEPGTDAEIKHFCTLTYKVDFPMFTKAPVSGPKIQPLYAWLLEHSQKKDPVAWNFEKFLISRSGQVIARFKSNVKPESKELTAAIEAALAQTK